MSTVSYQASLPCGTEGLSLATLIPRTVYGEKQQLECYHKNSLFLTVDVPGMTSQMEQMYTSSYETMLYKGVATIEI